MESLYKIISIVKEKAIRTYCSNGDAHVFHIIKGSGEKTGIPTWECIHCEYKVKSS